MAIWKGSHNPILRGQQLTMVINHLLTGMILQVGGPPYTAVSLVSAPSNHEKNPVIMGILAGQCHPPRNSRPYDQGLLTMGFPYIRPAIRAGYSWGGSGSLGFPGGVKVNYGCFIQSHWNNPQTVVLLYIGLNAIPKYIYICVFSMKFWGLVEMEKIS